MLNLYSKIRVQETLNDDLENATILTVPYYKTNQSQRTWFDVPILSRVTSKVEILQ